MQQMRDIKEFARRLGLGRRTVEDLFARGELPPPVRFGRRRCWSDRQIDAFIQQRVAAAAARQRGPGRPRA